MNLDFKSYLSEIKIKLQEIPDNNKLFWGAWICGKLVTKYENRFEDYLSKKEIILIKEIISHLWAAIDSNVQDNQSALQLLNKLRKVDETNFDTTEETECALYELIISLDSILEGQINSNFAWTFNVSQSPINVIDTIVSDEGIDLLSEEGAKHPLFIQEVGSQYKMLQLLRENVPATSKTLEKF